MKRRTLLLRIFVATCALASCSIELLAANILWDGTGTSWNVSGNWSLFSNATTPNPSAKPGANDTAVFNIETVNTAQAVTLSSSEAIRGLIYNSTGGVVIQTLGVPGSLTIGADGIIKNPGSDFAIFATLINLSLSAPQTWLNDSTTEVTVRGGLSSNGHTLTIDGSGDTIINGQITSFVNLAKNGTGTLTIGGLSVNAGTDLLINSGEVVVVAGGLPGIRIPATMWHLAPAVRAPSA